MSLPTNRNRLVVKIGTASLSLPQGGLDHARLADLAREFADLRRQKWAPLLVTSGAIGAGMDAFGWTRRPTRLRDKQAAAAVGQPALMDAYRRAFAPQDIAVAQVLLTRDDLADRRRYLNIRQTLTALLDRGVVPILNENDTVATDEILFGDNDTLAALIAAKMNARTLFLLTDVEGLLTRPGPGGRLLPEIFRITPEIEALVCAGPGSAKSAGGMATKISAARLAMAAGVEVWIASGRRPGLLTDLVEGRGLGTRFSPSPEVLSARRRWIAFGRAPRGSLTLDAGAVRALVDGKKSLLPAGVVRVEGRFAAGDTVRLLSPQGEEFARGLVNYTAAEVERSRGRKTSEIPRAGGDPRPTELVHRDNLALLTP
jgi:glutamate 5-kinase